ncbi:MAG: glycosyl transferase family 39 [Verrucomicrobiales bacterium]|nr:glycosyl transferase family 39 [Verrucomicrobiales bacterium]
MSKGQPTTKTESSSSSFDWDKVPWLPTRTQFFFLLLFYFGLHTIVRGFVSETAGIDDCDQIIRAQIWSWGYGPQPPLYTWLLKIFLSVFGFNIFAVTALKELALLGIYILTYANTRIITRSHPCGVLAAVAIQFNPSISWESHRELTHSILTSLFVLATIYSFLRLKLDSWKSYFLFGVCAAVGTLSKPNYLIFLGALLCAVVSLKETRSLILHKKMLMAIVAAALLCAPNAYWIWEHRELAFSSLHKFKVSEIESWGASMAKALPKWIVDLVVHVGPMLAVFFLIFWKKLFRSKCHSAEEKILWRTVLFILGIVTASILIFKVTGFRDRWLQPLFVWLPILLVAALREQLSPLRLMLTLHLSVLVASAVVVIAPGRLLLTEPLAKNEILNTPYRRFAADLKPIFDNTECIIAADYRIAGNLRLLFPSKFVTSPEFADLFPRVTGRCVLVWDTTAGEEPPKQFLQFAESISGKKNLGARTTAQEILKYHQTKTMQLATAVLD